VLDFLFEYYPYSPGRLGTWHPGLSVAVEGNWQPASSADCYRWVDSYWLVDATAVATTEPRLRLALSIMQGAQERPAQFSCFGMHEWAMVYRLEPDQVRHSQQALRLPLEQVSAAVDEVGLRCTHIDAFRFFTDQAAPKNAHTPTRANQAQLEQPGCLHANMDLFKYAMWFQPYVPGPLVLDCFEVAVRAREIDMRASPYDLIDYGYPPIRIETADGRREYADAQKQLAGEASSLRRRLIDVLVELQRDITPAP